MRAGRKVVGDVRDGPRRAGRCCTTTFDAAAAGRQQLHGGKKLPRKRRFSNNGHDTCLGGNHHGAAVELEPSEVGATSGKARRRHFACQQPKKRQHRSGDSTKARHDHRAGSPLVAARHAQAPFGGVRRRCAQECATGRAPPVLAMFNSMQKIFFFFMFKDVR